MRKRLIEWGITAAAVGAFMFYGQFLVDYVKTSFGLTVDSWQLYAGVAFAVLLASSLVGKLLTRGLKE